MPCVYFCFLQAWIFAAVDSDNPRLYYWFAALYALPLLRNGFDFDWFTWAMLGAGVVHVQVGGSAGWQDRYSTK